MFGKFKPYLDRSLWHLNLFNINCYPYVELIQQRHLYCKPHFNDHHSLRMTDQGILSLMTHIEGNVVPCKVSWMWDQPHPEICNVLSYAVITLNVQDAGPTYKIFPNYFRSFHLCNQRLTHRCTATVSDTQPVDLVARGLFVKAVPNAESIRITNRLEFNKNLKKSKRFFNLTGSWKTHQLYSRECVYTLLRRGRKFLTKSIFFKASLRSRASLGEMFVM